MGRGARPTVFLTADERAAVEAAIAAAEKETSAEIRVVISRKVKGDALNAAQDLFHRLKMHETKDRNAVLILLATRSRTFALLGDEAIHEVVRSEGWVRIRDGMAERFRAGDFAGGLAHGIGEVGRVLRERFPWRPGDVDELTNDLTEE